MPPLDNHDAIQAALGHIISGLAADRMDPKSATAALYAIQCALQSLKQRAITAPARKLLTPVDDAG